MTGQGETQVQVSITDGGAGFKHYKYAITDNKKYQQHGVKI